jgi:hypothetical protein
VHFKPDARDPLHGHGRAAGSLTTEIARGAARPRSGSAIQRGGLRFVNRPFHPAEGDSARISGWQAEIMQRPLTAEMH